ncbi:MAG: DMT family transporter [Betaproteobacteria bacterium]
MSERVPIPVYTKLVGVAAIWGGTFIAARIVAPQMSAPAASLWRYLVASVALVAFVLVYERGFPRLDRRQWLGVTLLGATGVAIYNLFFMAGMEKIPASRGSLIVALNPAATLLGGVLFLGEPLTRTRILGVIIALAGVVLVLGHGNPLDLFRGHVGAGEAQIFGAVLAWAAYTLIGKRVLADLSPLVATTCAALIGTAMLAVITALAGDLAMPPPTLRVWLAFAFLGVFGTGVAFVWFYEGVKRLGPARTAVFVNLVPVFAIAFGVLLLGERVDASMIVGGLIVVAGVWLLNRPVAPVAGSASVAA